MFLEIYSAILCISRFLVLFMATLVNHKRHSLEKGCGTARLYTFIYFEKYIKCLISVRQICVLMQIKGVVDCLKCYKQVY